MNTAIAHESAGDPGSAYLALQLALERRPRDATLWMRVGLALASLERPQEAAVHLTQAATLDPTSSVIRYELAKSLAEVGLPDRAEAELETLLERIPAHANGLQHFAALAAARGDAAAAAERLGRALAAGPSDPERFRWDPRFDPVRSDPRVLAVVRDARTPRAFREDSR